MTFAQLYTDLLHSAAKDDLKAQLDMIKGTDQAQGVDCLLHPEKHPIVINVDPCTCSAENPDCVVSCIYNAIHRGPDGTLIIDNDHCVGCEACIKACQSGRLTASRDVLPVLDSIKNATGPVYAMVAPAIAGQLGGASAEELRPAFKRIGFAGMIEVAFFADILTLKEALEFNRKIRKDSDYMLTSCCCPIWIAMVRRGYKGFLDKMPDAVSPMVAAGRALKKLNPSAVTVFVGPCLAKKAEAREKDIADAVDFVLTFEELRDIFEAFHISLPQPAEESAWPATRSGRIYGRTGGVSEAVRATVQRLNPHREIEVRAAQADGTKSCRELLDKMTAGEITANFLEGMGCPGGCVGGPKAVLPSSEGRLAVEDYADKASSQTPLDSPSLLEMLGRLGYETIDSLMEDGLFTRHFDEPNTK